MSRLWSRAAMKEGERGHRRSEIGCQSCLAGGAVKNCITVAIERPWVL